MQPQVLNLIVDIRDQQDVALIAIPHNLEVVRHGATDPIVMRRGKILERARTTKLLDKPTRPYTQPRRGSVSGPGRKPERAVRKEPVSVDGAPCTPTSTSE